jgi:peptide/nickel transport system substrate-binding protein
MHVYESLVDIDYENFHDVPPRRPGLAQSWEADPSGESWTFRLQDGVRFDDGTPFNAEAVKFNFDRYIDPAHSSFYEAGAAAQRTNIGTMESVEAVDALTVRVNLKSPDVEFLSRMENLYMVSPAILEEHGNENYHRFSGGTGPFKLVSNEQGVQAELERIPDYWGSSRFDGGPFVDKIVIRFIVEPAVRVAALQSGEADWIAVVPPDSVASLQGNDNFVVGMEPIPHTWAWILNFKHDLLIDKRVRQALALSVNRESLAQDLLRGTAEPALQFWAPGSPAYRPTPREMTYGYEPERAKQLLDAAGHSNGIDIKILTPNSGSGLMQPILMNEFIQENMADVGINVEIEVMEWQSFFAKWREGQPPEYAAYVQAYPTQRMTSLIGWMATSSQPPNGTNSGWFSNAEFDNLIDQALATHDEEARNELYQRAYDLPTEDVAVVTVVHDRAPLAWAKHVKGFVHPRAWYFPFYKTWLDT